jgi:hypothetical protein
MGYSLSWVAVDAAAEKALSEHFGLHEMEEEADSADFDWSGARLDGWYLLVADRTHILVDEDLLSRISSHGRVIAVAVEEHVMYSSAEDWRNGERIWGVAHQGESDVMHLAVEGELPSEFAGIRERQYAEQGRSGVNGDVDHIHDVPLQLAEEITTFRHDSSGWPFREISLTHTPKGRGRQRPIQERGGTKERLDKKSRDHRAVEEERIRPGLFARLFGKR